MQRMAESVRELLRSEPDLERALTGFYLRAIDLYVSEGPGHLGCMVTSTASLESARDSEVRALLEETVHRLDKALTERFRQAGSNDAPPLSNAESRGPLATAILHSLSIRARAGQSRRELREFARASVALLIR